MQETIPQLEAARCANAYLTQYRGPEQETLAFSTLLALVTLALSQLQEGVPYEHVRFTGKELAHKTAETGNTKGPREGAESSWLAPHWKGAIKLLTEIEDGLTEFARENGYQNLPVLRKQGSTGGRRQQAYYWLDAKPLENSSSRRMFPIPPGGIRYRAERRRPRKQGIGLYMGQRSSKVRRATIIALIVLIGTVGYFMAVGPMLGNLGFGQDNWPFDLGSLFILLGVGYGLLGPLIHTLAYKVSVAPFWTWAGTEPDPVLLEAVQKEKMGKEIRRIDLVRYTSTCPICGGRIVVGGGGLRFWGRLVGRCANSPREHVYSFDHVTKVGVPLALVPPTTDKRP